MKYTVDTHEVCTDKFWFFKKCMKCKTRQYIHQALTQKGHRAVPPFIIEPCTLRGGGWTKRSWV